MVFLYKLSFYTMTTIHFINYISITIHIIKFYINQKKSNIIIIIVFMFYIFECTYLARNNYSEKTAFEV